MGRGDLWVGPSRGLPRGSLGLERPSLLSYPTGLTPRQRGGRKPRGGLSGAREHGRPPMPSLALREGGQIPSPEYRARRWGTRRSRFTVGPVFLSPWVGPLRGGGPMLLAAVRPYRSGRDSSVARQQVVRMRCLECVLPTTPPLFPNGGTSRHRGGRVLFVPAAEQPGGSAVHGSLSVLSVAPR